MPKHHTSGAGDAEPDHEVAIIGAGLSGIGAAIALRRAGFDDLVILERADDVGGTWRDNTYPGVGVDVPSQAYQFSYDLKPDWSRTFAKGAEVKDYIDDVAARHEIRPLVRFNSPVTRREWDEDRHWWNLTIDGQATMSARFVISAIGAFVEPKTPDIDGLDTFAGTTLTSTAWDHDVSLEGKRTAIIGTGASAVQIIPEIAGVVERLDVYQRTPIWMSPKPDLPTPRVVEKLFRTAPPLQDRARRLTTRAVEVALMGINLNYDRAGKYVGPASRALRDLWYRSQVHDPIIRDQLTPDYDFGCKRPSVSNTYLRTFNRKNVALITDPIAHVTPTGITSATGETREIDVLVLATGFRLATDPENYRAHPVVGRDGFDLATFYSDHRARSYEGVSMPGLPNHFMIFGPYGWTGGTWHELVETASNHIVRVLTETRRRGSTSVEVREEAADRWTAFAAERMTRSTWQLGDCATSNSYYLDHHGDSTFGRPTTAKQAWDASRTFPLDDYRYQTSEGPTPSQPITALAGRSKDS